MKTVKKQVVGIDVAAKELVVSLGRIDETFAIDFFACKTFANNPKGFKELVTWTNRLTDNQVPVLYVMEATGVYHEALAYFLSDQQYPLSVVLPNKISHYARTLEIKTVTDKTSSQVIARFGLERKLEPWQKPKEVFRRLRELSREREQLVVEKTELRAQLHAQTAGGVPGTAAIKRLKARMALLERQEKQIRQELQQVVKSEKELQDQVERLCTIPG